MRKLGLLVVLSGFLLAAASCSDDDEGGGSAGKSGSAGTGGTSDGSAGTGGSSGQGGSAGSTGGSAGASGSAGAAGTAGAAGGDGGCPSGICYACKPVWANLTGASGADACALPDLICDVNPDGTAKPGGSAEKFDGVFLCACDAAGCATECDSFCNQADFPSAACVSCLPVKCKTAWDACSADDGTKPRQ